MPAEPKLSLPGLAFAKARKVGVVIDGPRELGMDHDHVGHVREHRDRLEVLLDAVGELRVERLGDRVVDRADKESVAVGRGPRRRGRAHRPTRPTHVLHIERLSQRLRELCRDGTRENIDAAPGGKGVDDPDRPIGPLRVGRLNADDDDGRDEAAPDDALEHPAPPLVARRLEAGASDATNCATLSGSAAARRYPAICAPRRRGARWRPARRPS